MENLRIQSTDVDELIKEPKVFQEFCSIPLVDNSSLEIIIPLNLVVKSWVYKNFGRDVRRSNENVYSSIQVESLLSLPYDFTFRNFDKQNWVDNYLRKEYHPTTDADIPDYWYLIGILLKPERNIAEFFDIQIIFDPSESGKSYKNARHASNVVILDSDSYEEQKLDQQKVCCGEAPTKSCNAAGDNIFDPSMDTNKS
uniref:Uncharacterized protein n=1 Tax=Rhizophagus irregularis (strain DAOM 181602 / DAOM 197198 / MUCL 43194) TaxID=747089 RepID=U9U0F8_RHIID